MSNGQSLGATYEWEIKIVDFDQTFTVGAYKKIYYPGHEPYYSVEILYEGTDTEAAFAAVDASYHAQYPAAK